MMFDKEVSFLVNSTLPNTLPKGIEKQDALMIAKNSFQFKETENGIAIEKDGKLLTDKVGNVRKPEDVLQEFYIAKEWTKAGGRGGTDSTGEGDEFSQLKSTVEVIDWCRANGKKLNEYATYAAKAKKENKDFTN